MLYQLKGNFFNNKFHLPPKSGPAVADSVFEKGSPADTETILWSLPVCYNDINLAIESAKVGFKNFKRTDLKSRVNSLVSLKSNLESISNEIVEAMSNETGRPSWDLMIDLKDAYRLIDSIFNQTITSFEKTTSQPGSTIVNKPIGPTLIITPSSDPLLLPLGHILSTLLSGNSLIFKPSEKVPRTSELLFNLFVKCGLPAGTVNLIQGDSEIARRLIREKDITSILFFGKNETALELLELSNRTLGRNIRLLTGGKNLSIIHHDVDIDKAINDHIISSYLSCGQRYYSTSVVAVHQSIADQFIEKFHSLSKKIIVDHPTKHKTTPFMGPLIDKAAADNYLLYMGMAKRENIEEVMRGKLLARETSGYYVSPSIHLLKKFNPASRFFQSEIAGPNVLFVPYFEVDEAINIVNQNELSLSLSIYSNETKLIEACESEIISSSIFINRPTISHDRSLPQTGIRGCGNYRHISPVDLTSNCYYQSIQTVHDQYQNITINGIEH